MLDEDVVGATEIGERGVVLERQHRVSTVDFGRPVHGADEVTVLREAGHRQQRVGHLCLGVAIRW